ncbi:MAG: YqaJ viral recombinase family protein [Patescibacteria group bacterium]|nr:YqaJ viral recombinase family protein [Patescibacteria group bacterium]
MKKPKAEPEIEIIPADAAPQGGAEWKALRVGKVTASRFADAVAGGDGKVRSKYLRELAGEVMTGEPAETFFNRAMERGKDMEGSLRATFEIETGLQVEQVSFVKRQRPYGVIGASPDGLVGEDAGLEIKKAEPHVLIDILRAGRVPPEYVPQLQGNMLVTDRPWWWLAIGFPGMPMFKRKVPRDSAYCARLEVGLETFQRDLDEMVAWLRNYGKE